MMAPGFASARFKGALAFLAKFGLSFRSVLSKVEVRIRRPHAQEPMMKKTISLCLMFALTLVISAQDEVSSKKATTDDYKKLQNIPRFSGKVSGVSKTSISFHVDDSQYRNELKMVDNLAGKLKALAMQKLKVKYGAIQWLLGKEVELEFAKNVSIRKLNIIFEYDDKGFPKNNKLPKLPGGGYAAKVEDITVGSMASVTMVPGPKQKPLVTSVVVDNK